MRRARDESAEGSVRDFGGRDSSVARAPARGETVGDGEADARDRPGSARSRLSRRNRGTRRADASRTISEPSRSRAAPEGKTSRRSRARARERLNPGIGTSHETTPRARACAPVLVDVVVVLLGVLNLRHRVRKLLPRGVARRRNDAEPARVAGLNSIAPRYGSKNHPPRRRAAQGKERKRSSECSTLYVDDDYNRIRKSEYKKREISHVTKRTRDQCEKKHKILEGKTTRSSNSFRAREGGVIRGRASARRVREVEHPPSSSSSSSSSSRRHRRRRAPRPRVESDRGVKTRRAAKEASSDAFAPVLSVRPPWPRRR